MRPYPAVSSHIVARNRNHGSGLVHSRGPSVAANHITARRRSTSTWSALRRSANSHAAAPLGATARSGTANEDGSLADNSSRTATGGDISEPSAATISCWIALFTAASGLHSLKKSRTADYPEPAVKDSSVAAAPKQQARTVSFREQQSSMKYLIIAPIASKSARYVTWRAVCDDVTKPAEARFDR